MQMHEQIIVVEGQEQPISRTYQYRKVMKPMLERKRRARINRCLDELKELMVTALAGDGENVAKLEKADILELTVRHLHKLQRQQRLSANPVIDADRFRAGYTHCANEVSRCLAATPGVDVALGTKLMTHLGHKLNSMDKTGPLTIHVAAPQSSPSSASELSSDEYAMPLTPASSQPSPVRTDIEAAVSQSHQGLLQVAKPNEPIWRPW
ncbi:enhancer of split m7 protein [Harpegnathos saltator]|uniref:Enhancer of split m7 protein-like n=2 Tax=Ponerini TaxID=141711 RepID=A0A6P3XPE0_DINQU|nr:enhancer of split m7 protein [Harpegnathos saltator]XP_014479843.1 PREDICTED: enhancer of split m7 protein-like [Dinoponera quadriceps]EFN87924.1 Enhancer of split mgamma protein [Harpegnathos saltator]